MKQLKVFQTKSWILLILLIGNSVDPISVVLAKYDGGKIRSMPIHSTNNIDTDSINFVLSEDMYNGKHFITKFQLYMYFIALASIFVCPILFFFIANKFLIALPAILWCIPLIIDILFMIFTWDTRCQKRLSAINKAVNAYNKLQRAPSEAEIKSASSISKYNVMFESTPFLEMQLIVLFLALFIEITPLIYFATELFLFMVVLVKDNAFLHLSKILQLSFIDKPTEEDIKSSCGLIKLLLNEKVDL